MTAHRVSSFALILALAAAVPGCSTAYDRLASETTIPRFAELVSRRAAMPRQTVLVPTARPGEPEVRVAVCQTGNPSARGPIIVFVHGAFSDAQTWRYVVGALGGDHTLWLIDLPGCGESDKPRPRDLAPDGYGPDALGERLYQALGAAVSAGAGDRDVVFVAHSTGAMVVTRMLADPAKRACHRSVLGRVAGAVLISPLDVAVEKPVPTLEYIAHLGDARVEVGHAFGMLRDRMAKGTAASYDDPKVAPREEVDRGVRIITDGASRHALQAMILQATPRRRGEVRPDWPEVDRLVSQYANIDLPIAIAAGAHDETLPVSMSYKLAAQIPGATLQVIPNCMHSPHLEHPETCAQVIRDFLTRIDQPSPTRPSR